MNIKACLSSNTDEWKTPKKLFDHIIEQQFIDLFPFQSKENQYLINYNSKKLYVNPQFSNIRKEHFFEYIENQLLRGNKILLLMPNRTDTIFFKKIYQYISYIVFITGRLHFSDSKAAPFPTILLYLRKDDDEYGNIHHFYVKTLDEILQSKFNEFGLV